MPHNKEGLSRIKLQGFKSIKNCDIRFRDINVLIGSNGAGKSNFVSIFSLLQSILSKNLQLSTAQRGVNSLFYNGIKETEEIGAEFFFGNNSYGFNLIPTDDNRIIFRKEYFGYHGAWDNESNIGYGHPESMWDKGAGNDIDKYVIPILSKLQWRVYHFHDTSRSARVKQEHNISNNQKLMFDASNLAAFLYRLKLNYRQNYDEIVTTIRLIAPFFSDFVLEPQEGNLELIVLKWMKRGCEDVFNASQLSDGTLRFMCLTTLLLQPEELQPATIIIDEPELGLHPYAITMLAEMIRNLPENKQIIISTQSVELLNEFDAEDVIVVDSGENGSEFRRLNSEDLEIWLEEDYALGDLWKKNILGGRLSR